MTYVSPTPIVFFSSKSENTLRFVNRLNLPSARIPVTAKEPQLEIHDPYILIIPTYGAGKITGSVPPAVIRFLNVEENRRNCIGVVTGGNTTFGLGFCSAGDIVSRKLNVPHFHKFEVLGLKSDVRIVRDLVFTHFPAMGALADAEPGTYSHPSAFMVRAN